MTPPRLTDRTALRLHRKRALRRAGDEGEDGLFLHRTARDEIEERLNEVNRTFTSPVVVCGLPEFWSNLLPGQTTIADDPTLDVDEGAHDLVIHALALHWSDDPVGQIIQARRALRPDGLFLGVCFGGQTLHELRSVLAETETRARGGLSPRVAPMGEIRDLGALLQRAGFALPVADSLPVPVTYKALPSLVRDLRAMGENNALHTRDRRPLTRGDLALADRIYRDHFPADGDRIKATFELVFLTGWAPAASQPQPLRPGSARNRLADALGTTEKGAGDPAGPARD